MPQTVINRNSPDKWKQDIIQSVDFYNSWFMEFAPGAFRETRKGTAKRVEQALKASNNLEDISCELLKEHPEALPILRMSTCPPIARDRLVGLAHLSLRTPAKKKKETREMHKAMEIVRNRGDYT